MYQNTERPTIAGRFVLFYTNCGGTNCMPNVYDITPLETFAKEIIPAATEM
jgi:hypothetical protein